MRCAPRWRPWLFFPLVLVVAGLIHRPGLAAEAASPARLSLPAGKSLVIDAPGVVKRVSVGQPEIADFIQLSPSQIYLSGKTPGETNLTLWNDQGHVTKVYDVEVGADVAGLKKLLHELLGRDSGIEARAAKNSIYLSGTARSSEALAQASALAESFAPGKVVNMAQVAGVHQVMLEVRVAEMTKSLIKRMGFNFNYIFNGDAFYSFLGNLTQLNELGQVLLSPKVSAAFSVTGGKASWSGFIDALKEDGLIKVLAEPTLICLSGQTADFLAGGEIPIPIPQGLGAVAIDYKAFGVGLKYTPTVLSDNRISLRLSPEVSELDYTNAITINSFSIPAITTRRASTVVELSDGQSFAIAGLLKDNARETLSRFPGLGDLPVLGTLFKSNSFQKNESELVIIATPRLVKPLDEGAEKLPTDGYREPGDLEFFLGMPPSTAGEEGGRPAVEQTRLDGPFGHVLPDMRPDRRPDMRPDMRPDLGPGLGSRPGPRPGPDQALSAASPSRSPRVDN